MDDFYAYEPTNSWDNDAGLSHEGRNANVMKFIEKKDTAKAMSDANSASDTARATSGSTIQIDPAPTPKDTTARPTLQGEDEERRDVTEHGVGTSTHRERTVSGGRVSGNRNIERKLMSRDAREDESEDESEEDSEDDSEDEHQRRINRRLVAAAREGDIETVRKRLNEGADLHAINSLGVNALHIAVMVTGLLEHKPDLSITGINGWTPLQYAVMGGIADSVDITAIILRLSGEEVSHQSDDGDTALIQAVRTKQVKIATAILANPYGRHNIDIADTGNVWTALHWACYLNLFSIVQMLLGLGANIRLKSKLGATALHIACEEGHEDAARLLLASKAPLNTRDDAGRTPLHGQFSNSLFSTGQTSLDGGQVLESYARD
jgi:ankyrin repeat protein